MPAPNSSVHYDAHSFIINGKREFLTSGSIHYFRVPRALWRDRLEKAKAAGLNTIQTYVAWNWHEPREAVFDFTGDHDFEHFLRLCEEFGLFVVARPGPYICAEWDFGGFPAWLLTKRGLTLRHHDPVYLQYVDRWFEKLIPIIARHQVSRGGCVILVQIENELGNVVPEKKDADAYMSHLRDLVRKLGIEVPLITCAGTAEGAIEAVNSHEPADQFPEFRSRQPNMPVHCTEFWTAWYLTWHRDRRWVNRSPEHLAYHTWRVLAEGGSGYNYYMWYGGTNFAYTTMYLQTTSYDYDAPLSEAGGIGRRGRLTIPIAHFAQAFAHILADSDASCEKLTDGIEVWRRSNSQGTLLFCKNPSDRPVTLPAATEDTKELGPVHVPPESVAPIVAGATIAPCSAVRLVTACPVHGIYRVGACYIIVLMGARGSSIHCTLVHGSTGRGFLHTLKGDEPVVAGDWNAGERIRILVVPDAFSGRVWCAGDRLVIGASYARAVPEGVEIQHTAATVSTGAWTVNEASMTHVPSRAPRLPAPPALSPWDSCIENAHLPCKKPRTEPNGWVGSLRPVPRDLVGDHEGYGWYRAVFHSREARTALLHIEAVSDRALVFVNGGHVSTSIEPVEDRRFQPSVTVPLELKAGENVIAVLVDNLGHVKGDWQIGEVGKRGSPTMRDDLKGILGRVWVDADEVLEWEMHAKLLGEHEEWYRPGANAPWGSQHQPSPVSWYRASFTMDTSVRRPLWVRVTGLNKGCIWVNGHHIGRYWNINGHTDYCVPECWLADSNTIVLFEETDATPEAVALVWDDVATLVESTVVS
ncbi:MAG TPA: beta-galactosidase [Candidatus Latescibacteria bacterium]|nr:beta-galactosidase [Candidatus Latescibacterota bacterium]HOS64644.1 beta-galactosidase [Candidatus Latescibacterota bacterium]HPK73688.1 beta-galactosidase [Candidatus Latescibacterota bacterium]